MSMFSNLQSYDACLNAIRNGVVGMDQEFDSNELAAQYAVELAIDNGYGLYDTVLNTYFDNLKNENIDFDSSVALLEANYLIENYLNAEELIAAFKHCPVTIASDCNEADQFVEFIKENYFSDCKIGNNNSIDGVWVHGGHLQKITDFLWEEYCNS